MRDQRRWEVVTTGGASKTASKCVPQVAVVEDHHEVLEHIHAAFKRRSLPFTGVTLVHFDAHPDMLFPPELPADAIWEPQELYDSISIADWVLPLVFAGTPPPFPPFDNKRPRLAQVTSRTSCGSSRSGVGSSALMEHGTAMWAGTSAAAN